MDLTWEPAASTLGAVVRLPLPAAVLNLLASLQPPRSRELRRSRRGGTGWRPLLGDEQPRRPDELDPATLHTLPPVGAVHLQDARERPLQPLWSGTSLSLARATPADVLAGRSPRPVDERSVWLRLLLIPHGVELAGLTRSDVLGRGITQILWSFGSHALAPPLPPSETRRRSWDGDDTLADVRGHLVLVSYTSHAGTTLNWRGRRAGVVCSVAMKTPVDPVLAVERLAQDTHLLPATAHD